MKRIADGATDRTDERPAPVSRREVLKLGALTALACMTAQPTLAAVLAPGRRPGRGERERSIQFHNLHTGERLRTVYWADGGYVPDALAEVDYILRDFRAEKVHPIDPRLVDLLHALHRSLDTQEPFGVISGYRTPRTNAMLAAHSRGVALHSMHIEGKAVDIRVPGRSTRAVRDAALALQGGGVGYYPVSRFVHVDVGRVRRWRGRTAHSRS
jgi:uncharacterized protein YcbK (DUF882 family)